MSFFMYSLYFVLCLVSGFIFYLMMFHNLTKELEKRGILRSDPRLTPVTAILKNIYLEHLDRSEVTT